MMSQCGRCGLNHPFGVCRAINAKCLNCYIFGHFARVCRNNNSGRSPCLRAHLKKKRDTERMTAFLRRKDAENLPFNGLCNSELQRLSFNSLLRLKTECGSRCKKEKQAIEEKVGGLEASVSFLRIENSDIKITIKSTADDLERIKKENKEIKSASRRKDNRVKQFISESEKNAAKVKRFEQEKEQLYIELGNSRRKIRELESTISSVDDTNEKIEILSRLVAETENVVSKERLHYAEIIQNLKISQIDLNKTNQYQHCTIQKCKQDISELSCYVSQLYGARIVRNFYCRKCGSTRFHERHKCPATSVRAQCMFCQGKNHFAIFCEQSPLD